MRGGKVWTLTGAFLGFLIGSGVATGQEVMQYYSPYGWEMVGTALTIAAILIVANYGFAYAGKSGAVKRGSEVFSFYCGGVAGKFFDAFAVAFCYMLYTVMIAGGAATLFQQYEMPLPAGAAIAGALSAGTVCLGLRRLVEVIGKITPVMVFCIFSISVVNLGLHAENVGPNLVGIEAGTIEVVKAGPNWFLSGLSNGGFCILFLAGFTATLGMKEKYEDVQKANVLSSVLLVLVNSVIGFSIISKIDVVHSMQIPNLFIAGDLWSPLADVFGILIFLAIYTTASPLLWTVSERLSEEGSSRFAAATLLLAAGGIAAALYAPFSTLLHYVFTINGYLGFVVLAVMTGRMLMLFRSKAHAPTGERKREPGK